jgi:hypothetical protein
MAPSVDFILADISKAALGGGGYNLGQGELERGAAGFGARSAPGQSCGRLINNRKKLGQTLALNFNQRKSRPSFSAPSEVKDKSAPNTA